MCRFIVKIHLWQNFKSVNIPVAYCSLDVCNPQIKFKKALLLVIFLFL